MSGEMGLILFRRAMEVGFHRLTTAELQEIAQYETAQLERLAAMRPSVDKAHRGMLHNAIMQLAHNTAARRRS